MKFQKNKNLYTIIPFFKSIEAISHNRSKVIIKKLFSLFGKEIKNNNTFIFSFDGDFIYRLKVYR